MKNLLYYNIQKWALVHHEEFKEYNNNELNKIIMGFECIDAEDG